MSFSVVKTLVTVVKILENRVVLMKFDFWNETKKSGHLDHPLPCYGEIHFNIFLYISAKAGFLWFPTGYIKKKLFREGFALDYVRPLLTMVVNAGTPPKKCFFKNVSAPIWRINIFSISFHRGLIDI